MKLIKIGFPKTSIIFLESLTKNNLPEFSPLALTRIIKFFLFYHIQSSVKSMHNVTVIKKLHIEQKISQGISQIGFEFIVFARKVHFSTRISRFLLYLLLKAHDENP